MIIKTLVENTLEAGLDNLKTQHGISLYVEAVDKKILFDVGQDELFRINAEKLDVDIADIDYLIISHAHYDHAGGIKDFLEKNSKGKVVMSHNSLGDYYTRIFPLIYKYIGIDKASYERHKDRFVIIKDNCELVNNIHILNNTEDDEDRPLGNKSLYKKIEGKYLKDDFNHEIILAIKEEDGWVLFTGCSHSGILNMLYSFRKIFPEDKIKALIGGFHFMNPITTRLVESKETIENIGEKIRSFKIDRIYTGHCTGKEALEILSSDLKDSLDTFKTGKAIKL
ncbi:MBL fold metallo-hydrolase [Alkaliphilus peptidifermentans]|uniref:7,8-dihydropterin-6-yl-methyl-4-(Beta-D-ribofuranosyl)aminobenzene 5'-phosphate synthase n=1 Tax=Alkaliphilus peptidifermentans DSM 18978 TaxID=1120976 RepID=A0A1G5GYS9_9FIRM|nr:MBL fold metallo-hydrolase [Alkaliphilus peptidifermentans]SCY56752.1 7,8-dihydropterin-6-yl-methyl-4-(beta-D-ribofuranosyl)aminobenzene 5'-phosphate synthase [Alkaliphilus peptidifermentans DSM 18978]